MLNLSYKDKRILRGILHDYNIPSPKCFTKERLLTIEWKMIKEYGYTIMELLQKRKEENANNYLAIQISKELISEKPLEKYTYKWNKNIKLIID